MINALIKDDMEVFKQYSDNESFKRWMQEMIFGLTHKSESPSPESR